MRRLIADCGGRVTRSRLRVVTALLSSGYFKDLIKLDENLFYEGQSPWWQGYASTENMELARRKRKNKSIRVPA